MIKNRKLVWPCAVLAGILLFMSCSSSSSSKRYRNPVKDRKKKGDCNCPRKFSQNIQAQETTYELAAR